jgi:hypothetical protein
VRKSLVNTVLTVIGTIVILTTLYSQIWHPGLNDIVIRLETDSVVGTTLAIWPAN